MMIQALFLSGTIAGDRSFVSILIASTWFPSAYPSWLQGPCTADVSGKVRFHIEGEANLMGRRLGRHGPGPYPAELCSGPVT